MTENRRTSRGKILNIELDSPPGYIYTGGEVVSGRVTLQSFSDEDVYSIILQFTGTAKSYVGLAGRNQSLGLGDQSNSQVTLDFHQQLYQGNYKLRKDVTHEWPFKMRFPTSMSLEPSGEHGKHMMSNGEADIEYQLKASRATSAEQAKALTDIASQGEEAGLKSKVRSLIASTTSMNLRFLPSRPNYIDAELTPTREVWSLPAHANDLQPPDSQSKKFSFKSIFQSSPSVEYTVRVDLPKNFVQYEHIPAFIRIIPKSGEPSTPGPITVEKVEFIVSMRIRNKAGGYVGENLESFTILKLESPGIVINDSEKHDIGGQYKSDKPMWPTFNSDIVETRHNLRAHVTLNASGKKFKDIFTLSDCHIYPNRVTPSPLNEDYMCSFFCQPSPSSEFNDVEEKENSVQHKDATDSFFVASRLLTKHSIHPQVVDPVNPSAVLALLLPGQTQAKPHAPMQESSMLAGSLAVPDPHVEDQKLLSSILDSGPGFQGAASHSSGQGGFAYRWGGEKSASQVRLEFADATIAASSTLPPSYSAGATAQSPEATLPHNSLTLPQILTALLHSLAISDPSSPALADPNSLTIANTLHLCHEYSTQLQPLRTEIDASAAAQAVAKYPRLRRPLIKLAGVQAGVLGPEEDDEPQPRTLTKAEARFEKRKEMANKVGYWSATAQKRQQVYSSN